MCLLVKGKTFNGCGVSSSDCILKGKNLVCLRIVLFTVLMRIRHGNQSAIARVDVYDFEGAVKPSCTQQPFS